MKVMIQNPTRSRKFGFGYCSTPNGQGPYGVYSPEKPYYVGTIHQVLERIAADRTYRSFVSGGVCFTRRWFFDGQPVISGMAELLNEIDWAAFKGHATPKTAELTVDSTCETGGDSDNSP